MKPEAKIREPIPRQERPREIVAAMNDHYVLTGAVRGSDLVGVLGDPLGAIGVHTTDRPTFSVKEADD